MAGHTEARADCAEVLPQRLRQTQKWEGGEGTSEQYICQGEEPGAQGQPGMEHFIPGMCPTDGWCSEGEAPA